MLFSYPNDKILLRIIFAVALFGSVLSFLPLYSSYQLSYVEDPDNGIRSSYLHRESAIGTLILVMPTSMDIVLDVLLLMISTVRNKQSDTMKIPSDPIVIVRLTLIERSLFVVGVAMQSTVIFSSTDAPNLLLLYRCSSNCSALLTISPILMFLERCTVTYSYPTTISVLLFTAVGAVCHSASYYYDSRSGEAKKFVFIGSVFFIFAAIIYVVTSIFCMIYYISNHKLRKGPNEWRIHGANPQGGLKEIKVVDEMFENYIPAAYIASGTMFVLLNAAWSWYLIDNGVDSARVNYAIIGIATWVLLVEYRIRNNEVERGLVRS